MRRKVLDYATTAAGVIGAAIQASNVDWTKLLHGDQAEQGTLIGAVVLAFLGWAIKHPVKP